MTPETKKPIVFHVERIRKRGCFNCDNWNSETKDCYFKDSCEFLSYWVPTLWDE